MEIVYDDASLEHWYGVPRRLGIFHTIPYTPGISTTDLIDRVLSRG